jgi:hypothetical protein
MISLWKENVELHDYVTNYIVSDAKPVLILIVWSLEPQIIFGCFLIL